MVLNSSVLNEKKKKKEEEEEGGAELSEKRMES